jgi:hypothetical protein
MAPWPKTSKVSHGQHNRKKVFHIAAKHSTPTMSHRKQPFKRQTELMPLPPMARTCTNRCLDSIAQYHKRSYHLTRLNTQPAPDPNLHTYCSHCRLLGDFASTQLTQWYNAAQHFRAQLLQSTDSIYILDPVRHSVWVDELTKRFCLPIFNAGITKIDDYVCSELEDAVNQRVEAVYPSWKAEVESKDKNFVKAVEARQGSVARLRAFEVLDCDLKYLGKAWDILAEEGIGWMSVYRGYGEG